MLSRGASFYYEVNESESKKKQAAREIQQRKAYAIWLKTHSENEFMNALRNPDGEIDSYNMRFLQKVLKQSGGSDR